jgi:hypothetical protein
MGHFLSPFICVGTCGFVWWLFEQLEEKEPLRPYLRSNVAELIEGPASILSVLSKLPPFFIFAFDAIFTDKLFSLRGFLRSAFVSSCVMILLGIVWLYTRPSNIILHIGPLPRNLEVFKYFNCPLDCYSIMAETLNYRGDGQSLTTALYLPSSIAQPFLYNFIFDWIALMVTRRYLYSISKINCHTFAIIVTMVIAALTILVIASVGYDIFITAVDYMMGWPVIISEFLNISLLIRWVAFPFYNIAPSVLGPWDITTIIGVFLLSTTMGILWIFVFSIAVIISNVTLRITSLGPLIRKYLNTREKPYRSMGYILVALIFSICVIYHGLLLVIFALLWQP